MKVDSIAETIGYNYAINGYGKNYLKDEFEDIKGKITLVQIDENVMNFIIIIKRYYSPAIYQDYEQSLGRAYRLGQDKSNGI